MREIEKVLSLRIVIGLVATVIFDMVVEVDFSVGAPEWRMPGPMVNQCVLIRSDDTALIMREDDDRRSIPRAITLLGTLPGVRIRPYTEPLIWIVCYANFESALCLNEGLRYRFEMLNVEGVLW